MTVRSSVAFTDKQHRLAQRLVDEGRFASVSAVVAHGLRLVEQERKEQEAVIAGLTNVIRERAATPLDEFVALESGATHRIAEAALKRGGPTS
ncbi:MAG: ribbon-helix-helix domain-containing protein [Geminicoccaceae bacterium]